MANGNGAPPGGPPKRPMKKSTRNWLLIGTLAAGGLVVIFIMRSRQAAAGGAGAPEGIDPNTGVPYAQEYAGGLASPYGTTPSLYGYDDPSTGSFISGVGSGGSYVTAPSTNASWAQQVESYLQNLGYDPMAVAAAIGRYLTGQTLTADDQTIVNAA